MSSNDTYILGIFCYFHDSSACLLHNGKIIAMAEEERFNRKKHCSDFPENAIRFCLNEAGITMERVDRIAYGFIAWRFIVNQIKMAVKYFPKSLNLLRKESSYMPLKEKFVKMFNIKNQILQTFGVRSPEVSYVDHHTAHAYSTYFVSPFDKAAVLVIDGFGEDNATSFYLGQGSNIEHLDTVRYPNSLGVYYGAVTQYLGFRPHHDEYKVMGMAPYGDPKKIDFDFLVNSLAVILRNRFSLPITTPR